MVESDGAVLRQVPDVFQTSWTDPGTASDLQTTQGPYAGRRAWCQEGNPGMSVSIPG